MNHSLDFAYSTTLQTCLYQQSRLSEWRALTSTTNSVHLRNRPVAETCPVLNSCNRIKHSKYLSVGNACDLLIYPRYVQVGGMVVCFKVIVMTFVMTDEESKEKRVRRLPPKW